MTPEGQSIWNETIISRPAKAYVASDLYLLEQYVECVLDIRAYTKRLAKEGELVETRFHELVPHPLLVIKDRRQKLAMSILGKLRLTPGTRENSRQAERYTRAAEHTQAAKATLDDEDDGLLAKPLRH